MKNFAATCAVLAIEAILILAFFFQLSKSIPNIPMTSATVRHLDELDRDSQPPSFTSVKWPAEHRQ